MMIKANKETFGHRRRIANVEITPWLLFESLHFPHCKLLNAWVTENGNLKITVEHEHLKEMIQFEGTAIPEVTPTLTKQDEYVFSWYKESNS